MPRSHMRVWGQDLRGSAFLETPHVALMHTMVWEQVLPQICVFSFLACKPSHPLWPEHSCCGHLHLQPHPPSFQAPQIPSHLAAWIMPVLTSLHCPFCLNTISSVSSHSGALHKITFPLRIIHSVLLPLWTALPPQGRLALVSTTTGRQRLNPSWSFHTQHTLSSESIC